MKNKRHIAQCLRRLRNLAVPARGMRRHQPHEFFILHSSFFILFFILHSAFFICSCSSDDLIDEETVVAASDPEAIEITLTITMDPSSTRASSGDTWGELEDGLTGEDAENAVSSLQVLFFAETTDESGDSYYAFAMEVTQIALTQTTNSDGSYTFTYLGQLSTNSSLISESTAFQGRLVILANCSISTDGLSTYTDEDLRLGLYSLTKSGQQLSIEETGIPMWGVQSGSWTLAQGVRTDVGTVELLRAMAKIKVSLNDDMYDGLYRITGATLRGFSDNQGYILPKGYGTVSETGDLAISDSTFNPYPSGATQDSLLFFLAKDSSYAYIYVPEYDNPSDDAAYIHLYVNRYQWSGKTYSRVGGGLEKIVLNAYSDATGLATSDVIDLVRNHVYTFECYRTVADTVFVTTTVSDWNAVETSLNWENDDASVWLLPSYSSWAYASSDTTDADYILSLLEASSLSFTSTSGSTVGDAEAVYSMVMYPKWADEGDEIINAAGDTVTAEASEDGQTTNCALDYTTAAAASYLFFITSGVSSSKVRWKAHLTNENENGLHLCTGTGVRNSSAYYCTTGVSRDRWYEVGITLSGSVPWEKMATDYRGVKSGTLSESALGFDYDACAITASITDDDGTVVDDSLMALYADLFFTLEGTDKPTVLTINHYNSEWDVGSLFAYTWYPGGTYERTVTVDGETYTLGSMQWIRIYWFEARIGEYYSTPLQRIMDASDSQDQWL